jgi:hypothetical protein
MSAGWFVKINSVRVSFNYFLSDNRAAPLNSSDRLRGGVLLSSDEEGGILSTNKNDPLAGLISITSTKTKNQTTPKQTVG